MNKRERKTSLLALLKLLKDSKIPLIPFLVIFAINIYATNLGVKIYEYAGEIMSGNIFDNELVLKYVLTSIAVALIGILTIFAAWIMINFQKRTQQRVWDIFLKLPLKRLEELKPSSLVSRVTNDAGFMGTFLNFFANVFISAYSVYAASVVLFKQSSKLASYVVPIILVSALVSIFFGKAIYKIHFKLQDVDSNITRFFNERLSNMKLIKSSCTEYYEIEKGIDASNYKLRAQTGKVVYDTLWSGYQTFITIVVQAIVLIFGAKAINDGSLELGAFVTFFMLTTSFPGRVQSFYSNGLSLIRIFGQTQVVANINSEKIEDLSSGQELDFSLTDKDIKFENVSFGYDKKRVLDSIDLDIINGKITAIVGKSGSGKTTILKLIERFYNVENGKISINQNDITSYNLGDWRSSIGYIIQNSPLLPGTIEDNIIYGAKDKPDSNKIDEILDLVKLKKEVHELKDGINSLVGDFGDKLSSGQRQRIAIARALAIEPDILLMDEATANLDTINEAAIMESIIKNRAGKTTVVVAHRLNTIKNADNIIVMDKGKIVGAGTHDELLNTCPLYVELVG